MILGPIFLKPIPYYNKYIMIRLNKFLASTQIGSRRKADVLIRDGRVRVNGRLVTEMGVQVDPEKDKVRVDNYLSVANDKNIYLIMNKPRGYVCTHAKFEKEKSIFSLLPGKYRQLKIAGRLDKESEGLVILTNDGQAIYQITHPKFEHAKEYLVKTNRDLNEQAIAKLKNGIKLEEGLAKFDQINKIKPKEYRLVLHQGWNRQIRRMLAEVNNRAAIITRVRIGKIKIDKLKPGDYREINKSEVS